MNHSLMKNHAVLNNIMEPARDNGMLIGYHNTFRATYFLFTLKQLCRFYLYGAGRWNTFQIQT